jgi:hypothetical protein
MLSEERKKVFGERNLESEFERKIYKKFVRKSIDNI